jgi:hypothetical protein
MSPIQVRKDAVVVSGSYFIKHDYYFHRIPQLIEALYRIKHEFVDKNLKIIFIDGDPIKHTGVETVLETISLELDLPPSKLIVATVNKEFTSQYATVEIIPIPTWQSGQNRLTNWVDQKLDDNAVLFGAVFGRFTIERFLLASFLGTKHADKSFIIFHPSKDLIDFEFGGLENSFAQELTWYQNHKRNEFSLPSQYNGQVDFNDAYDDYKNIWSKYLIDIVAETDCHCKYWVTEKTIKCLLTGKPFIAMAGVGFMSWLQDLGFKTFDTIIDESYDREPRSTARVTLIKKEIDRIANFNSEELKIFSQQLKPITEYNQQNFVRIAKQYYNSFNTI